MNARPPSRHAKGSGWRPTAYLRMHVGGLGRGRMRQWWVDETGAGEWRGIEQIWEDASGWDAPPGQMPVIEGVSKTASRAPTQDPTM
jgi:hypothetical protein